MRQLMDLYDCGTDQCCCRYANNELAMKWLAHLMAYQCYVEVSQLMGRLTDKCFRQLSVDLRPKCPELDNQVIVGYMRRVFVTRVVASDDDDQYRRVSSHGSIGRHFRTKSMDNTNNTDNNKWELTSLWYWVYVLFLMTIGIILLTIIHMVFKNTMKYESNLQKRQQQLPSIDNQKRKCVPNIYANI
ncbi:uncharacterized protein LOC128955406 [Oppia nitens]|uniref:uncharacterized protein LOC128955406 n=1 Tax=Oppia nitens TaxID=1686743 RepID=UPI0023DCB7AB|nr:uncharacterized protein LOC128955406 [Oppia nitens]